MLTKIRDRTQGVFATIVLSLVTIPFVLWGVNSYFGTDGDPDVASVNGVGISQAAYRRTLNRMGDADSRVLEPAQRQMVLEQMIEQTLLVEGADDAGYRVSDIQLRQLIHELPYFQRDGRFDSTLYETLLRREGLSQVEFERRLRREQAATQLQSGLGRSEIVTETDIAAVVRLLQQERHIAYVVIGPNKFLADIHVAAREIDAHYAANPEHFQTPEEVQIEYLRLSAADTTKQYQPRAEELQRAYDEDAQRYRTPEKRRASHVLISAAAGVSADDEQQALERAKGIERRLRAGGDFAAIAKKESADTVSATKGGDLGEIRRGLLPKELEAAVYALKSGEISAPVRTPFGYHVVKLTSYMPEVRVPFETARKELIETVRRHKGEEQFYELSDRFRDLIYEHPESLEPAAKELGLVVEQSAWFTRAGGPGIAAHPKVIAAAFRPEVESRSRNSDAIEIDGTTLVAVRGIGHRPASLRPLAHVRAGIERLLAEQKAHALASERSTQWRSELTGGGSLADLAQRHGLKYEAPKPINRERSTGIDRRIVDAVFGAPRPANGRPSIATVDLGSQGIALVAVNEVRDGDPVTADAALQERARRLLAARRGSDYYGHYRRGLRRDADVKVYSGNL